MFHYKRMSCPATCKHNIPEFNEFLFLKKILVGNANYIKVFEFMIEHVFLIIKPYTVLNV